MQQHNPLKVLAKVAKQRQRAFEITGTLNQSRANAISKIRKEADHFSHLPAQRQAYKVISLQEAYDVIRSWNPKDKMHHVRIQDIFQEALIHLKPARPCKVVK
jgi:hypothetical protein